ncbi:MAG: FAD-dependent oxidoreductase [Gemmatimonadaceae bacterium]
MNENHFDAAIVGGGFYGARLALMLRARGGRVLLVEREPRLLGRASLRNQARVHNGYHYPRSMLTSLRSRLNYARFLSEYAECVDQSFPHYYAIARGTSKVTAGQFAEFCRRIGAPAEPARSEIARLFDASRIEAVFEVQECAFDASKLRDRVTHELNAAGVETLVDTEAVRVAPRGSSATLTLRGRDDSANEWNVVADLVLNCTYSRMNRLLDASGIPPIPAKHELTELALVTPPPALEGAAVTVMDGPFFSLMPYPSRGLFSLSHVRYTPHCSWNDAAGSPIVDADHALPGRESRYLHMVRDAERYLPAMRTTKYVDSLWEMKTLMPRSEQDDSRPILLRRSDECPSCLSVLGAKIDSVYDVEDALAALLGAPAEAKREAAHAG